VISLFKEKPSLGEFSTYNGVGQGSNKHRVEIVDTLNGVGNITVYPSIRQAAKAIGCVHATIRKALKFLNKNGESRIIKQRFRVRLYR
jgi:NUMOD1 domain